MNRTFSPAQAQTIDHVQALRAARRVSVEAHSSIGHIAMRNALAPLRELLDSATALDYPAALALATAMDGRDASDFTVRELQRLIAELPA